MSRYLCEQDELFLDFRNNRDDDSLRILMKLTNSILYAIVISFVFEEEKAEDILDKSWIEFIKRQSSFNPEARGILYEIYLIVKKNMSRVI